MLGDWQSLAIWGQLVESGSGLTAGESVGVIGHVGTSSLGGLLLQSLDLAGLFDGEVLEKGLGSLLMLVLDLLGLGVDLLLSLLLTSEESQGKADGGF